MLASLLALLLALLPAGGVCADADAGVSDGVGVSVSADAGASESLGVSDGVSAATGDVGVRLGQPTLTPGVYVDTADVGALHVEIDALAFFKDNEYDGDVVKGYSLPGTRLQPRLTYTPISQVRLELGLHASLFHGANKYPAYVFHDIATWKGNQYQRGAHVLPFFRATAQLPRRRGRPGTTVIALGDIYGGTAHGLLLPLYNPELLLTDDPEAGAQVIVSRPHWTSDVWLNWQSYIYELDTHQEAFTVGWTQRIGLPKGLSLPLQLVIQHRGGEQDITDLGVQTIANGAVGLAYDWTPGAGSASASGESESRARGPVVTAVSAEVCALFALQQSGELWPFDSGSAAWASAAVTLRRDLTLRAGCFYARDFVSLYGAPFFGTLSTKVYGDDGSPLRFDHTLTAYLSVDYSRTFAGVYTIGAKANAYQVCNGTSRTPFSFGIYFRSRPRFLIKRWRK